MPRIVRGCELRRQRPRGGAIDRRGRPLAERLVGPLGIVVPLPPDEAGLLRPDGRGGRARGLGFERPMEPFVPGILLGVAGLDELGDDAELDPPDGELREPSEDGATGRAAPRALPRGSVPTTNSPSAD